jgi:uracil-DNA glycosylase
LIGSYAQKYYLGKKAERNLTETVKNYRNYLPHYFPLPHPSPRNNIWMKKNPWFEQDLLPVLRHEIKELRAALSRK